MQQLDRIVETQIRHQQADAKAHLERSLLIREALADRHSRRVRFYRPALVNVGRQMVIWGMQLQRRYEDRPTAPTFAAQPK